MTTRNTVWLWALGLLALVLACSREPGLPKGIDPAKLEAVQAQVDFPLAVPRYLPPGLQLVHSDVLAYPAGVPGVPEGTKQVHMSFFAYPDGPGLQFLLTMARAGYEVQADLPSTPVRLGGTWVRLYEDPYREGRTSLMLFWDRGGVRLELWGFLERGLTRGEFLKIAASVR